MADVQKENGFTPIANAILENMATIKLSPTQYRIIFVIWRYTYGFNRKSYEFSLSFLANATGCDQRQIQRELKNLEARKIIFQTINQRGRIITFNKDYDQWVGKITNDEITNDKAAIGETTIDNSTIGETVNGENVKSTIGETVKGPFGETVKQERKYKDNIKDIVVVDVYGGAEAKPKREEGHSHDKVPPQCHESYESSPEVVPSEHQGIDIQDEDNVETFVRQVDRYYTQLTGRLLSPRDMVAITELANETLDFRLVKEAMDEAAARYKPAYKGDKIRSFSYFIPIIKAKLETQRRRGEHGTGSINNAETNTENDPYAGIGITL
jgi:phage replication O-like protein O